MVKIYSAVNGKKHKLLHEGYTLHEVVADLYEWGTLDAWDDLAREDLDEQIYVLCDYVRTAHQDYVIEYEEDNPLKCPNCGEDMTLSGSLIFQGELCDKWECEGCTHIIVLDIRGSDELENKEDLE